MSSEPDALKFMGTQSRETVNMEAAMAPAAVLAREREADQAFSALADQAVGRGGATAADKVVDAASRAIDTAKDTLFSAAGQVRDRSKAAVASQIRRDPMRAVVIATGVGALLMVLLSSLARSGARTVGRRVRR